MSEKGLAINTIKAMAKPFNDGNTINDVVTIKSANNPAFSFSKLNQSIKTLLRHEVLEKTGFQR